MRMMSSCSAIRIGQSYSWFRGCLLPSVTHRVAHELCQVLGVPIGFSDEIAPEAVSVMECQLAQFLMKYLVIPLSMHQLSIESLLAIMEKITDRLPSWMAGMMAMSGQLTLVKSILAAMPLHQLVVLGVSKRTMKPMEKFLWGLL